MKPFLALRSYLAADHVDKAKEIGSEATPGAFLDVLLDVVEECARVLTPHGSLVFELGDTYSGSGGAGGDYNEGGMREGQARFRQGYVAVGHDGPHGGPYKGPYATDETYSVRAKGGAGWPLDKSLTLVPQTFAWALAYGRNPWTGRETERWRVRNIVAWCRPNPPVGALGDKFRPATSYLTVACKQRDRWFDLDSVREPSQDTAPRNTNGPKSKAKSSPSTGFGDDAGFAVRTTNPAGAPPLDWWEIPTQPFRGSHYATWPEKLVVRPIEAMCPREVCTTCGTPRRRITENDRVPRPTSGPNRGGANRDPNRDARANPGVDDNGNYTVVPRTIGWSDCGHNAFRRGVVLDPFGGSGTTAAVCEGHGRNCVLIDLDERNAELARERLGMFLEISGVGDPLPDWLASSQSQGGARASA